MVINKKIISLLLFSLGLSWSLTNFALAEQQPLKPISINNSNNLGLDEQLWGNSWQKGDKQAFLRAINHSLGYLQTPKAIAVYKNYPLKGITRERVIASLRRFRQLLQQSSSPVQLQQAVAREFTFYQAVGHDNLGTVSFTGYFQPLYRASRKPTSTYRYPLYRQPKDFESWQSPHPTRQELEGEDGLKGQKSILSGYELVWLENRLQAYLVQVQGSAKLRLTDGKIISIGYDSSTDYPYTSIGKELIQDGKIPQAEMSLPRLIQYLETHPEELSNYLPRNNRFIFFKETTGQPPMGSLNVPVTGDRTIATDKSIMPPGALALIHTRIPYLNREGEMEIPLVTRYVLDQDTGSAIKGAGRVDIFLGSGEISGQRAGLIDWTGELYYLLLK
jgi:membrane-bound lytic murein transglycosylase A